MIFFFLFVMVLCAFWLHCTLSCKKEEEGRYMIVFFLLLFTLISTGLKLLAITAGAT